MIEVYEKAGLKPSNVAKLLNLSRVAVSLWFNGHSAPHRTPIHKVVCIEISFGCPLIVTSA